MPTDQYFAGFVDGEGYIGIGRSQVPGHSNGYFEFVQVSGTNATPLIELKNRFGGSLVVPSVTFKSGNRKPYYRWGVVAKMAEQCVKSLMPFLLVKKEQAKNLLKMRKRKIRRYHKVPFGEHILRDEIYWNARELNARGAINFDIETPLSKFIKSVNKVQVT